jgi:DNA-binding transcriptional ArsR family regulator
MESKDAVAALAALAQASRLAVFRALVEAGPVGLAASEIAARLGLPANTLSFHLKALVHAQLATARPQGRYIYYAAGFAQMDALIAFLTQNCCGGRPCLPAAAHPRRSPARDD